MSETGNADVGIWRLVDGNPQRYMPDSLEFEKYLEDWIDRDPSLISPDLQIVGRQVSLDSGYLDILGIDKYGRWAIIELKKVGVRRETVAQALDYAGCIAEMSSKEFSGLVEKSLGKRAIKLSSFLKENKFDSDIFEQREIQVYVVGTSRDINLDRVLKHTTFQGNPINVVTFDVYKNSNGEHVLLRQLTEIDKNLSSIIKKQPANDKASTEDNRLDRLFQIATKNGIGEEFRKLYDSLTRLGLYPKMYKWSIMYAPPKNKNRVLICTWVQPKDGLFSVFINTDAFAEFYPISKRKVHQMIDVPMQYYLTDEETEDFIAGIQSLFDEILKKN